MCGKGDFPAVDGDVVHEAVGLVDGRADEGVDEEEALRVGVRDGGHSDGEVGESEDHDDARVDRAEV